MRQISITSLLAAPFEHRHVGDVSDLVKSIKTLGLLNPITVTPMADGKFRLVAGAHRVEAAKRMGWTDIPAHVLTLNALQTELAIIDENLCRNELTALERGEQLARRKEIHEALFPETRHGGDRKSDQVEKISTRSFADDTATKTGQSARTVRHEVQIGTKIAPDVRDAIRDTPLADSKTDLLELARQPVDVQRKVVERMAPRPVAPPPSAPKPTPAPAASKPAPKAAPAAPPPPPPPLPRKPVDVRQAIREVRQEQRREEVAAKPAPPPERVPARVDVVDVTRRWPLKDESVSLIVTSPPYGVGIEYGVGDVPAAQWVSFMEAWLREAYRVAGVTGRLCVNVPLDTNVGGWRPTYAQTVQAALAAGWLYRNTIVWEESNVSRSVARGSVDSHAAVNVTCGDEMVAVFYKMAWARTDGDTTDIPHDDWLAWTNGHWRFGGESRAYDGHPAAFPEELPRRLIQLYSGRGATVLDPFCGSGTTLAVAHKLGRVSIGFDKDPQWVASTQRRLAEEVKHG